MILMIRKRFRIVLSKSIFRKIYSLWKTNASPKSNLIVKGNQEEYDQDEYIEFLNHLSDINATATKTEMTESDDDEHSDETDDDPEREAEVRLQAEEALIA